MIIEYSIITCCFTVFEYMHILTGNTETDVYIIVMIADLYMGQLYHVIGANVHIVFKQFGLLTVVNRILTVLV